MAAKRKVISLSKQQACYITHLTKETIWYFHEPLIVDTLCKPISFNGWYLKLLLALPCLHALKEPNNRWKQILPSSRNSVIPVKTHYMYSCKLCIYESNGCSYGCQLFVTEYRYLIYERREVLYTLRKILLQQNNKLPAWQLRYLGALCVHMRLWNDTSRQYL